MSYQTILAGLNERFATVSGINAILNYAPTAIQDPPIMYNLLDSVSIQRSGQVRATIYRILHRLVFRWQDFEQSELEVVPFVDSIPAAVEADPALGGRLAPPNHGGFAEINEIEAVWVEIAGTTYRALDFYSTVVEK